MAIYGTMVPGAEGFNFRNRIINGDMRIDQRNAGAEVDPAVHNTYYLDRWFTFIDVANKFKIQQVTTSPPPGFTHYLRLTVTNAYTSSSTERFALNQKIEGYNVADLAYGTESAKYITVSFWVRSSITGTFSALVTNDNATRKYIFEYTIDSADTWEYKTKTIDPLTAEALGNTTTLTGLRLWFDLGSNPTAAAGSWITDASYRTADSQKWLSNAGATLDFTGVQLEVGEIATPFERRPYGTELQLCQRYFQMIGFGNDGIIPGTLIGGSNTVPFGQIPLISSMRAHPTIVQTATTWRFNGRSADSNINGTWSIGASTAATFQGVGIVFSATANVGETIQTRIITNGGYFGVSAEL